MRVVMTRTVRVANQVEPFEIGVAYDLPDPLAEAWISYGVADRQEAPEPPADPGDSPAPAKRAARRDAAAQRRVTEAGL